VWVVDGGVRVGYLRATAPVDLAALEDEEPIVRGLRGGVWGVEKSYGWCDGGDVEFEIRDSRCHCLASPRLVASSRVFRACTCRSMWSRACVRHVYMQTLQKLDCQSTVYMHMQLSQIPHRYRAARLVTPTSQLPILPVMARDQERQLERLLLVQSGVAESGII
jgi:hypothetical protein